MYFSNTPENVRNSYKGLLNNMLLLLNKLIKSSEKCNSKTKTYFSFAFHLRNSKDGKEILFTNMNTKTKYVCQ